MWNLHHQRYQVFHFYPWLLLIHTTIERKIKHNQSIKSWTENEEEGGPLHLPNIETSQVIQVTLISIVLPSTHTFDFVILPLFIIIGHSLSEDLVLTSTLNTHNVLNNQAISPLCHLIMGISCHNKLSTIEHLNSPGIISVWLIWGTIKWHFLTCQLVSMSIFLNDIACNPQVKSLRFCWSLVSRALNVWFHIQSNPAHQFRSQREGQLSVSNWSRWCHAGDNDLSYRELKLWRRIHCRSCCERENPQLLPPHPLLNV